MDALLEAIVVNLLQAAKSEESSAASAGSSVVQSTIDSLVRRDEGASDVLHSTCLLCAATHCAPVHGGLLCMLAAAAHCRGGCTDDAAAAMAMAGLRYLGTPEDTASPLQPYLAPILQRTCSGSRSAAHGCGGQCACRSVRGMVEEGCPWRPELLPAETSLIRGAVTIAADSPPAPDARPRRSVVIAPSVACLRSGKAWHT
jgi:hypothetical protein